MKWVLLAALLLLSDAALLHAQTRSAAPYARTGPLVIGETFTIASTALKELRRINVYLPPGYTDSVARRFPVLYMPDGGMAEDFLHVAGLVQVSVSNGTMRPFILVGIENTERRRDMTGPTTVDADKRIAPRVGGSAAFRAFIRNELMPQVRARYRTTAETAIVGESLAGLFVVETFLTEPDLFDSYMAFDPSLWWNDKALARGVAARLAMLPVAGRSLFIATSGDAGLEDVVRGLSVDLEKATSRGLRWIHEPMPQETHATIFHPAALRAFRELLKPVSAR